MMKISKYVCNWCGKVLELSMGDTPEGWTARSGIIPIQLSSIEENKKWFEPVECAVDFCSGKCNQAHKEAAEVARIEANKSWLRAYNELHSSH